MRAFVTLIIASVWTVSLAKVILPLHRSLDETPREDGVHALVTLQHHINHAQRRAARLRGLEPSSPADDHARLLRRYDLALQRRQNPPTPIESAAQATPSVLRAEEVTGYGNIGLQAYAWEAAVVSYHIDVGIGTPAKTYKLLIDTGSMDTFVPSDACTTCQGQQTLSSKSSTSLKLGKDLWQVEYGKGWVAGQKATDTMRIGDLTIDSYEFGVSLYQGTPFRDSGFDGLIGMGVSHPSTDLAPLMSGSVSSPSQNWTQLWAKTPLEAMVQRGLVKQNQLGFYLHRSEDKGPNYGSLCFGGTDETRIKGELTMYDDAVTREGFWTTPLDGFSVGNGQATSTRDQRAILDTGTTLVMAPVAAAVAIHKQIPGAAPDGMDGFTIPCNTNVDVKLTMGSRTFAISSRDLTFNRIDETGVSCTSGIAAWSVPNAWLLGDVFLRNVYHVIDGDANQVGLAEVQAPVDGDSSSTAEKGTPRESGSVRLIAPSSLALLVVGLALAV